MKGFRILFTLGLAVVWAGLSAMSVTAQTVPGGKPGLRADGEFELKIKPDIKNGKLKVKNGNQEVETGKLVKEGTVLEVVPVPESGYRVKTGTLQYVMRGKQGESDIKHITDNNTFKMPDGDITLEAVFVKGLTLELPTSSDGKLVTEKVEDLKAGDVVKLTAEPKEGYTCSLDKMSVLKWTVGGDQEDVRFRKVDEKTVEFDMPDSDVVVSTSFFAIDYKVRLLQSKGGLLAIPKGDDTTHLHFTDVLKVLVKPDVSYQLMQGGLKWRKVGAAEWTTYDFQGDPKVESVVSIMMPSSNIEVKADFERDPATIKQVPIEAVVRAANAKRGEKGGSVVMLDKTHKPLKEFKVRELDTVWVECTPEPGWKFQAAQYGGTGKVEKNAKFKFQIPDKVGGVVVMVWFAKEATAQQDKPTGVESDARLSVYPNPCDERVNVLADGVMRVQLFNLSGALVLERAHGGEIELGQLSAGVYVLRVHFEDGSEATHRIVRR